MNKDQLLQKYLDHSLTEEEKTLLEKEIKENPDFQRELEEASEVRKAIIAHKKEELKSTFKTLEQPKKRPFITKLISYGVAASVFISILVVAYFLINSPVSNEALFAENFEPYRNIITPIERSEATPHNKNQEYVAFYEYETGNYETALLEFTRLYESEKTSYYLFYKAICELQLNKVDAAIGTFLIHQKLNDTFKEKGKWYLALAYLKNNDIVKCKLLLEEVIKHKSYNYTKAKKVLESITTN
ncbi:MAG: hypothetical protein CMP76_01220 [Flavobacterium sp.]|uniref:tetratricopeptide repeat protein n=1 Tax=Flavobacterium sp. TaxID=239 RepID=UPI000C4420FA|nr:hypothetical protein [Flavobacterium sp.]MBF01894.1 hypothetical protein [Flavobacterium sp.]|tara:strand:+ start:152 stop:883 length:732 start_codon:yes stop_codon:yes gene_type:complete